MVYQNILDLMQLNYDTLISNSYLVINLMIIFITGICVYTM